MIQLSCEREVIRMLKQRDELKEIVEKLSKLDEQALAVIRISTDALVARQEIEAKRPA